MCNDRSGGHYTICVRVAYAGGLAAAAAAVASAGARR